MISDGINSGDTFKVNIVAKDSNITVKIYKNGNITPVVNWNITDSGQKVGWIRLMTWNLNEAQINDFKLAGPEYTDIPVAKVSRWEIYN